MFFIKIAQKSLFMVYKMSADKFDQLLELVTSLNKYANGGNSRNVCQAKQSYKKKRIDLKKNMVTGFLQFSSQEIPRHCQ